MWCTSIFHSNVKREVISQVFFYCIEILMQLFHHFIVKSKMLKSLNYFCNFTKALIAILRMRVDASIISDIIFQCERFENFRWFQQKFSRISSFKKVTNELFNLLTEKFIAALKKDITSHRLGISCRKCFMDISIQCSRIRDI